MKKKTTLEQTWLGKMRSGQKHFDQGQPDKAVKAFRKAAKLCPQRAESWVNLGSALLEARQYDQSRVALEKALALEPELMLAHMILGDTLRELGRWPGALASYQKALSLERTPLALNKLACALGVENRQEQAEGLYLEAIERDPEFTIARVNLATLQIERGRFDQAREHLSRLQHLPLPPPERHKVASSQLAIAEYFRLRDAITLLNDTGDTLTLETTLRNTPEEILQVDENTIAAIARYADSSRRLKVPTSTLHTNVPKEWPRIEAMFMIPHVNTAREYLNVKRSLEQDPVASGDLLESINMEPAILAARDTQQELLDPIKAEVHLRHWHALACRNLPDYMPGHFKYAQNWMPSNPTLQRTEPTRTSGTLRCFIENYYQDVPPGLARAAVVCMAVCDMHAFADGNGRVGITWLNRELEWAGLAPALFSRELGIRGKLGAARREVRSIGGNLEPLVSVITEAQQFGLDFCRQLADLR